MSARPDWWGWGDPTQRKPLPQPALAMLRDELGDGEPTPALELEVVQLPEARELPDAVLGAVDHQGFTLQALRIAEGQDRGETEQDNRERCQP